MRSAVMWFSLTLSMLTIGIFFIVIAMTRWELGLLSLVGFLPIYIILIFKVLLTYPPPKSTPAPSPPAPRPTSNAIPIQYTLRRLIRDPDD